MADTTSLYCAAHSCLFSLQEQPQIITIAANIWIPIMAMVIDFLLVTAGSCSGCTECFTLHDSHRASFDYRRQKKGGQRQIWWPCSSGGSTAVSKTSDSISVCGSQYNEWSKVWFKWASPDPSNWCPLSVITTLLALCLGLHTGSYYQGCGLYLISPC